MDDLEPLGMQSPILAEHIFINNQLVLTTIQITIFLASFCSKVIGEDSFSSSVENVSYQVVKCYNILLDLVLRGNWFKSDKGVQKHSLQNLK